VISYGIHSNSTSELTTQTDTDFTVKTFDEMENTGFFVKARASLGATAFGLQILQLPPDSANVCPEHDHLNDGQEEVYVLLDGSGHLALPGGPVELAKDKLIRVGAATRRRLRSGPDGATVLVIGGIPGKAYAPQAGTGLGEPPVFSDPNASSDLIPDGPAPQLDC
jgi:mannose-6-phosphate isomerase-like protein (cupin superfamily)